MGLQVALDFVRAAEALSTHGAAVGLLPGVDSHVHLEVGHLGEALAADLAAEGLLARVAALVLLQPAGRAAALAAHAAAVRLLPRVHLNVHVEVACVAEGLTAHLAAEGRHVALHGGLLRAVRIGGGTTAAATTTTTTLVTHVGALTPAAPGASLGSRHLSAVLHPLDVYVVLVGAVGVDRRQGLGAAAAAGGGGSSVASASPLCLYVSGRGPGRGLPLPVLHPLALGEARGVGRLRGIVVADAWRREHGLWGVAGPVRAELLVIPLAGPQVPLVLDLERKALLVPHAGTPLAPRVLSLLLVQQGHRRTIWPYLDARVAQPAPQMVVLPLPQRDLLLVLQDGVLHRLVDLLRGEHQPLGEEHVQELQFGHVFKKRVVAQKGFTLLLLTTP